MSGEKTTQKSKIGIGVWTLVVLVGLAALCVAVGWPLMIQISDQAGPFYLTFSTADIDGDGDTDVLVHNMRKPARFEAYSGGTLWFNQGGAQGGQAGTFSHRLNDIEGGGASTLADLDGDGDPDALVYAGGDNGLVLGLNQGGKQGGAAGVFRPSADLPAETMGFGEHGRLATGDIDGDGRTDALLLGWGHAFGLDEQPFPDNVSWTWLNKVKPDGQFETEMRTIDVLEGLSVAGAALGDVDGDGDLDLAAAVAPSATDPVSGSTLLVLLNNGKGSFSDSRQRLPAPRSSSVALGDLDGDSDLDAAVGTGGGAAIFTNQGGAQGGEAGKLEAAKSAIPGGKTRSVHLADMDNDGDADVLVAGGRRAQLWWNVGEGRFQQAKQSFPCNEQQDVTVADFNGDGRLDIFVAQYDARAWVWMNDGEGGFDLHR